MKQLTTEELSNVTGGGNIFYEAGKIIGTGLYWFCKGASAIKG
ncbi:lactococcin G-alpha/enterocin 1071A family bacteriocin [Lacticaseibacillus zeae]|uniref:Lactococcin G-alpha/enterocin 1071A family bacteriocin n=1 Tax=Lacticaseibacillus zeae subsp. silagei TaxID=3068307 RepID=A0ABD7Z819_LACZE|nr:MULTISPECIES: lactococcin G-alpha/enterocin 1071A family bacteriocin [Lacticaseibacillus]MDE3316049.1 lactococcin G-alpha/enterocin 1071A family bacteriocin [Lacticaseibacillus zeae]WLV83091.1 lactococcin G-alpha/enterocin 1071A family bacteriocin [Lacticaseibacillus sp. NCIMB 15475]WLV85840.1 lactococcin G-alpha/enterocin 1071A family bacteriocin [Lacticaseibacillus sp. NCIMB 15474]